MASKRLERIIKENARFEKQSPYNFCDRWCQRCANERQARCKIYQDEFEQKITCIAHGRHPDDPEVTEEVLKWQYEGIDEKLGKFMEEHEINVDEIDDAEMEKMKERDIVIRNLPLNITAGQYGDKMREFLKSAFGDNKEITPGLVYDFETLAWYHTILPVKLNRALSGFHEPPSEYDFGLCDAVAQFTICKKAINESIKALRNIAPCFPDHKKSIKILLALLQNISSRITAMEESI